MPFELRPEPHPTLRPEGEYLRRAWAESVYPLATRMGVTIRLPPVSPQPHTRLAWEGYQYAKEHGRGTEYNHQVLEVFFVDGRDLGDVGVLAGLAGDLGLDANEFRQSVAEGRYRAAHQAALRHATEEIGITGVPAFEIGGRMLVGVQSREALTRAIDAADADPSTPPSRGLT